MNELLRETLAERAEGAEPPAFDLDGIVAAGNRRANRRRVAAVLGSALVTLAVIAGGISVARSIDHRPAPAQPPVFTERRATYAVGSEIHYGNDVISVAPYQINAFVQTDAGFVFLDKENAIHVVDKSGVRELGKSAWRLTADNHGTLVAWVEDFNDRSESVVYDVAANREVARTPIGNARGPLFDPVFRPGIVALDGNHAYFGTFRGLYRWDVKANKGDLIADVSPNAVRTVSSGQMVYQVPLEQPKTGVSLAIGPKPSNSGVARYNGQQAFLSPGAKYLVTEPEDAFPGIQPSWAALQLFEVGPARGVRLSVAYSTVLFGQWLDDKSFTAAGADLGGTADLLTCSAQSGACNVTAPAFSTFTFSKTAPRTAPFTLPTGAPIYHMFS